MKGLAIRPSVLVLVAGLYPGLAASPLPSPLPAPAIEVSGRVLLPDGRSAGGIELVLSPLLEPYDRAAFETQGRLQGDDAVHAKTGADGRFTVRAPGPGLFVVRAEAEAYGAFELPLVPLVEGVELPPLELRSFDRREVAVLDAGGKALPGALVGFAPEEVFDLDGSSWRAAEGLGVADEKGKLIVRAPPGATITAWAPGFSPASANLAGAPMSLRLETGMTRVVRVLDERGRPLPKVLLRVGDRGWPAGATDERGQIAIHAPRADRLPVHLDAGDGRRTRSSLAAAATPNAPPLDVRLAAGIHWKITVLDRANRRPLAGAVVWRQTADGLRGAVTGPDGSALLSGHRAEERPSSFVQAAAAGYLPSRKQPIALASGEGVTVELEPAVSLFGEVADPAGEALAGVLAAVTFLDGPARQVASFSFGPGATEESDGQGRFVFRGLAAGNRYLLTARSGGFAPATLEFVAGVAGTSPVEPLRLRLQAGRAAVGSVLDLDGEPIAGATVWLTPRRESPFAMSGSVSQRFVAETTPIATTDRRGRFELARLLPDRYDLFARAPGFVPVQVPGVAVEAGAEPADLGTLYLEPALTLEGKVVDEAGQPLADVAVSCYDATGRLQLAPPGDESPAPVEPTAADGSFRIVGLPDATTVVLTFSKAGYLGLHLPGVQVPLVEPLLVTLEWGARVSGRVITPEGGPVSEAELRLTDDSSGGGGAGRLLARHKGASFTTSDMEGLFRFEGVAAGRFEIQVTAPPWQPAVLDGLEVAQGGELAGLEITLEPGAVLAGRVRSATGQGVSNAMVWISPRSPGLQPSLGLRASGMSDSQGEFRLEGLEAGPVTVHAHHERFAQVEKEVEIRAGTNQVDLTFEPGTELDGRVVDERGIAIGFANVQLTGIEPTRLYRSFTTTTDGRFRFEGVPNGEYQLAASHDSFAESTNQRLEVRGLPLEGLEIVLSPGVVVYGQVSGLDLGELPQVAVSAYGEAVREPRTVGVDFEGKYRLEGLPAGDMVIAAGTDRGRLVQRRIKVSRDAGEIRVDLEFETGFTVSGRVLLGTEPLSGATVWFSSRATEGGSSAETNYQGAFAVEGLARGTYDLHVTSFDRGVQHVEEIQVEGDRTLELTLPLLEIEGRIVDATDGTPLPGATISFVRSGEAVADFFDPFGGVRSDSTGRFRLRAASTEAPRLLVSREGYAEASLQLETNEGKISGIEIALEPSSGLELEVTLATGQPVRVIVAGFFDEAWRRVSAGMFQPTGGRFVLSTAPKGSWRLAVTSLGQATVVVPVVVPGPTVKVQLPQVGELTVIVPALADDEIGGALTLTDAAGTSYRSLNWSGSSFETEVRLLDGRARIDGLPVGPWRLLVTADDGRRFTANVEVSAGATLQIELEETPSSPP